MVIRTSGAAGLQRFELRPNRSLSDAQARAAFALLAGLCMGAAGALAALGFWPVLPFAGTEVALLGGCLAASLRSARASESVAIAPDVVAVTKAGADGARSWEFPRGWTRVRLASPAIGWHPSRLTIGSHGHLVQVGGFLREDERRALAHDLERACPLPAWND